MTHLDRYAVYFVLDVESVGLHGEGFAVGYVVVDSQGSELASGRFACGPEHASGTDEDRAWIEANVPPIPATHDTPAEVRERFWEAWATWKKLGAVMVADCGWPVEARFLAACVDDYPAARTWEGPYPLHDLASVALVVGDDPLAERHRRPNELPAHDPLADARQSARLLLEMLARGPE